MFVLPLRVLHQHYSVVCICDWCGTQPSVVPSYCIYACHSYHRLFVGFILLLLVLEVLVEAVNPKLFLYCLLPIISLVLQNFTQQSPNCEITCVLIAMVFGCRYDPSGLGDSEGRTKAETRFSIWLEDAKEMLLNVAEGPQIVICSSMGCWVNPSELLLNVCVCMF